MSESLRTRVDESHVAPLNELVRRWRADPRDGAQRFVPWFDPDGPGLLARVLVLMESPGPRTVAAGDLGFSSEDNDDPTAGALRTARASAGMARDAYVRWNVVPWPMYDSSGRRRPPLVRDLDDAREALADLWAALPELRVVVAVGTPALQGVMRLLTTDASAQVVPCWASRTRHRATPTHAPRHSNV